MSIASPMTFELPVPAPVRVQPVVLRPVEFTNTETSLRATLPGIGKAGESPKGLGWDGNKPLMRNRTATKCHPR